MARDFNSATPDFMSNANAVFSGTGTPFSMSAQVNPDTVGVLQTVLTVGRVGSTLHFQALQLNSDAAVIALSRDGTSSSATVGTVSVDTWQQVGGVWASDTSRIAYLDGNGGTENTTSRVPSSLDKTSIGVLTNDTTQPFDGEIAEAGIWNVALTAADMAALAKGMSPKLVRPDALIAYWPIIGRTDPEPDLVGGFNLTVTTAVWSAHPRIIYPTYGAMPFAPAAAVGIVPLRMMMGLGT